MRVVVDFDRCQSNAVCMDVAPEIFEVRDDNFLYILDEKPPEASRSETRGSGASLPDAGHLDPGGLILGRRRPPGPGGGRRGLVGRPVGHRDAATGRVRG